MTNIMRGVFRTGERVQLTGPKGRLNTITLREGAVFGTHRGDIKHDDIIGKPDGSVITNQAGVEYLALRPPASYPWEISFQEQELLRLVLVLGL